MEFTKFMMKAIYLAFLITTILAICGTMPWLTPIILGSVLAASWIAILTLAVIGQAYIEGEKKAREDAKKTKAKTFVMGRDVR